MTTPPPRTCRYCRYWTVPGDNPPLQGCSHPSVGQGEFCSAGVHNGNPLEEGYFASGPDFGCIHFEGNGKSTNPFLTR